ncbi:hypothetical protein [Natrialba chahannaoensis]|uniref:hypothetical protein n=1 Tax=Natrialba chahannaoensis TaxID=68911 RepID=UPI0012692E81|nr:hypothetical protein [Natrialba chahannaoensis]
MTDQLQSTLRRRGLLAGIVGATTGLSGCLGDTEFRITDVEGESNASDTTLSFDLEIVDRDIQINSPGSFELFVTNEGHEEIEIVSTGISPFGVLDLERIRENEQDGGRVLLWSDEYEESSHVDVSPASIGTDGEELVTVLPAGESESYVYEIRGGDLPSDGGEYRLIDRWYDEVAMYRYSADTQNDTESTEELRESSGDNGESLPADAGASPEIRLQISTQNHVPFM